MSDDEKGSARALIDVMRQLRDPENGCPWDVQQTFASIAPYTIEEAYEVADAIQQKDMAALKDELGDLLLQVVFHARMAEEENHFDFDDVVEGVVEKMTRRHPHVFGGAVVKNAAEQTRAWEEHKAQERAKKAGSASKPESVLDGIAIGLPALMRSLKLQKRAARVGFDWPNMADTLAKLDEELGELREEIDLLEKDSGGSAVRVEQEMGDLLMTCVNVARKLNVDPESALAGTNEKFQRRFEFIEEGLRAQNKEISETSLSHMEELWQAAKKMEKADGS